MNSVSAKRLCHMYLKKSRVAQVVRHHDGGVERREVEGGDRHVVVASVGLDDGGPLEVVVARLALVGRDQEVALHRLPQQLGDHLE